MAKSRPLVSYLRAALTLSLLLGACGDDGSAAPPISLDVTGADLDLCMNDWPQVGRYRITNLLGDVDAAVAVAESPTGGVFPPGTLIQLFPGEAMLKREPGFDASTNDWEFFALDTSVEGTTIVARGAADTVNMFGGNCYDCHSLADPEWDFVCGSDHGCDPLPVNDSFIALLQRGDLRCR